MSLLPSCLMPEIYAPWKLQPGFVLDRVRRLADDGFYRSVEIGTLDGTDRLAIGTICRDNDMRLTCWITDVLEASGHDICAIDEQARIRAVKAVIEQTAQVVDAGAQAISMVAGNDPGPSLRRQGYDSAFESLRAIGEAANSHGMTVMIEPLDRFAHKKRLIWPVDEAVALIERVQQTCSNVGLAFDTAHAALNGETIVDAMRLASAHMGNLHLSNAVLDSTDPLYGDHHMPPGEPGFLSVELAVEIVAEAWAITEATGQHIPVAIEARALPGDDIQASADIAHAFLKTVFQRSGLPID